MIKKLTIMVTIAFLMFSKGGNIMADYNIQMGQRNLDNTEWDNHYPITKAENVLTQYGTVASQVKTFHASKLISILQAGEPATIAFLGDSITDDYYVTDGHVNQLSTWLNTLYPNQVTVINAGVGGNNIKQMWDRVYKDVLVYKPDLVVISSGTNDEGGGSPLTVQQFHDFYNMLIQEVIATNSPDIILRSSTPTTNTTTNANLENYNAVTKNLAQKYNIGFFDAYKWFQSKFEDGTIVQTNIMLDGVHLNFEGQTYLTEQFKTFFTPTDFVERPDTSYKMYSGIEAFKIFNTTAANNNNVNYMNGQFISLNSPGQYIYTEFEGDEISIVYTSGTLQGQFIVEIDDIAQPLVDTYSSTFIYRNFVTYKVDKGKHHVKIIQQATKNEASTDTLLHIHGLIFHSSKEYANSFAPSFVDFAWYYQSVDQSPASGTPTLFISNSRVDETKLVTANAGTFTLNKAGIFDILFTMRVVTTENADIVVWVEVNGSINRKYVYEKTTSLVGTQTKTVDLHDILPLNQGDYIKIYVTVGGTTPKVTPGLKLVRI